MGSVQMSLNVTPFDGLSKADLYRLFDKLLPRNLLHVALPPNLVKFTQLARFMAERAYDLFLASAPDDVCACPSGIAVWALTPLDMPGPLVPLCAVRRSTDIVSPRRYQRPQAASARLPVPLLPARSVWHTYRAAWMGRWTAWRNPLAGSAV
jgi:hypothetical protein